MTTSLKTRRVVGARAATLGATLAILGAALPVAPVAAQDGYTAPAADTTATLKISNWGDPNDQAVYAKVAERFKAKYPNVTIEDNFTPITTWTDYINKLVADVAAGNAPDVINIAIEGVQLGISKDMFQPLDSYVANDPAAAEMFKDVDPRLLDGLGKGGVPYLLPGTWNTMLMYYNTKMFEEAGIERPSDDWTWDDFLEIAKKLTTGDGDNKVYGFVLPWFNFGITPWLYSNGTSQLNEDWTASNLTDPKVAETATWIKGLVDAGVAPDPTGADPYQLFPAGKAAMTGAGHWVVGSFDQAGFSDYDVLPWPSNGTKSTVYGISGYGIYPGSANKDLAWEYIKEMASIDTQKDFVAIGAANPSYRSLAESAEFLSHPAHADLYYNAIEYAKPVAAPTVFNVLDPAFMRAMGEVMAGTDATEAFASADAEVADAFANQ